MIRRPFDPECHPLVQLCCPIPVGSSVVTAWVVLGCKATRVSWRAWIVLDCFGLVWIATENRLIIAGMSSS